MVRTIIRPGGSLAEDLLRGSGRVDGWAEDLDVEHCWLGCHREVRGMGVMGDGEWWIEGRRGGGEGGCDRLSVRTRSVTVLRLLMSHNLHLLTMTQTSSSL